MPTPAGPRKLISAATFLTVIDQAIATGYLSNPDTEPVVEVAGVVDLSARRFRKGLRLERIVFCNAVKMGNCRFVGPVRFNGCSFYDQLDFAGSAFSSGVEFSDCLFEVRDIALARTALNLNDAHVTGDIDATLTTIHGCISARRLHLAGNLAFSACTIEGNSSDGDTAIVDLTDSKVVGFIGFEMSLPREVKTPVEAVKIADEKTIGTEQLLRRSTFVDHSPTERVAVRLRNATVTDLLLAHAHFVGNVDLHGLKCIGITSGIGQFALRPGEAETRPSEPFGGAQIDGDLVLSGGNIGFVHLLGIVIKGFVHLIDGLSGHIEIGDGIITTGRTDDSRLRNNIRVIESVIGNFVMTKWNCRDHVYIHPKQITGVSNPLGIEGVLIQSSEIHGDLSFWPGLEPARKLQQYLDALAPPSEFFASKIARLQPELLNRWQRGLLVSGNLTIDNCTITDNVILTGINVVDPRDGRPGGRIRITNCDMKGDVQFASPVSYLTEKNPEPLLMLLARYFVAREIASRSLMLAFRAPDKIRARDVASLIRTSSELAHDIIDKALPSSEIARLSNADAQDVRRVLLGENPSHDEIAAIIRANPELMPPEHAELRPSIFQPVTSAMATGPRDDLIRVRDFIMREIAAQGVLSYKELPTQIVDLVCERLEGFRVAKSFKHAACNTVEMSHLSAHRMDLTGLRVRSPGDNDNAGMRERRVDLRYAQIHERLDTWVRLESRTISEMWSVLNRILLPPPIDGTDHAAVPAFSRGGNRERDVLLCCFGEDEIKLLESIPAHRVEPRFEPESASAQPGERLRVELAVDIPGALDLQHAKIDELYLSDDAFRNPSLKHKANEQGILLDYARINKLYVARSQLHTAPDPDHNGFPVPLSLLKLSVQTWFLEQRHDSEFIDGYTTRETETADPYLDLLDNDRVFRMSAYLEIEKLLRDRGLERQANRVFIAGRYRDVRIGFGEEDDAEARARRHHQEPQRTWRRLIPAPLNAFWNKNALRLRNMTRWWTSWRPGDGRYRRKILFRLNRPLREYFGFALCAAWCIGLAIYVVRTAGAMQAGAASMTLEVFGVVLFFAVTLVALRHAMRVFFDHLFWSVLAYGTNPTRLVLVILVFAGFSLGFVSHDPHNFEPTLAAEAAEAQKQLVAIRTDALRASEAGHHEETKWDETRSPKSAYWPIGERVWMTLRFHVPLVAAVVSDEWQPADKPLRVLGLQPLPPGKLKPDWWPLKTWPRARDWFGLMLWANWLLWPFFLPYLIRKLMRNDVEE